ncbi:MAG: hypothetical protein GTO02_13615 [Candidatus Dadabacteria bacterium]|nr:hypothetical protein [Candidatus Dadabacteria bacterium]
MQKFTYRREFSLIKPKHLKGPDHSTRYLKAHNVQSIQYLLDRFKIMEGKQFNLYTSLAVYKNGIPNQTLNMKERKIQNAAWKQDHWKHIIEYDFFLDIDSGGDIKEAAKQTSNILQLLEETMTPYTLRFSGEGFHILVPETEFPKQLSYDPYGKETIYHKYRELCLFFKDNAAPLLDDSIYDSQRQIKLPYSIALYKDKERVCLPINNNNLEDFNEELMTPLKAFQTLPQEIVFNPLGSTHRLLKLSRVKW